jgi:hypothetical protein
MKDYTVIYTESVGRYGASYPKMLRVTLTDKESLKDGINRAGYESQVPGQEWDIMESVVFIFEGHPTLQGDRTVRSAGART